ncbi:MAG: hypothetical protein ACXW1Y_07455, partial [Acidimicrobiia bacterium]
MATIDRKGVNSHDQHRWERTDVIVGVDTHKDQHAAVAIDGLGPHRCNHHLNRPGYRLPATH